MSEIVAVYDYVDESGNVLYQTVRYKPKDFRQRRPVRQPHADWEWSLGDVRRVMYRLPEVAEGIQTGRWIFLCEGEKDADNMVAAGFCATTACGGTSTKRYAELHGDQLKGASICILPDNDDAGRKKAKQIAKQLHGIAKGIKIAHLWFGTHYEKWDATNWLQIVAGTDGDALCVMAGLLAEVDWHIPPPEPTIEKPKRKYVATDLAFEAKRDIAHNTPISEIAEVSAKGYTRCPLRSHEDKNPSCHITRNLWYCHPCCEGGDTIGFKQERDKVSFPEAVRLLAGGG